MHGDADVAQHDHLARADLGGLARLRLTVDGHSTVGDDGFACAAAVDHACEFEQLVQLDVVGVDISVEASPQ